ncbi:MAG TPA: class I SAM-dependent methyltransferase [Methylocystis sp.]|nr:class I SAM-dependent methyltransferase [Methylocystis sp.]
MSDAAALMDRMYRPQRRIYDLTRKFYLLGRDRLIAGLAPPPGSRVLEIGCGTGRNLILAARRYPQARFYGVDISEVMLAQARESVARAGVNARIELAQGDASAFDAATLFGEEKFERIFISYALSMIPPWRETIGHALDLLAPGGTLHIVDFGDQAGLPGWFKALLRRWLTLFHVSPREDLAAEVARQAEARGLSRGHTALYGGYAFYDAAGQ